MATVAGTKRLLDISGNNISTAVSLEAEGTFTAVSGTMSGDLTVTGTIIGQDSSSIQLNLKRGASGTDGNTSILFTQPLGNAYIGVDANGAFSYNIAANLASSKFKVDRGGNATFAGDVTVSGGDITVSNAITGVSGGSFRVKNNGGTTIATFADNLNATFAGNVGIGTTTPSAKLEVVGGNADSVVNTLTLKNDSVGNSAGVGINFVVDGVNDVVTSAIYGQRTASAYHQGSLQFLTRDSVGGGLLERMRIDEDGNVGIGTTSPTAKLEVAGNIGLKSDSAYLRFRNAAAADLGFITNSTTWGDSGSDFSIGASSSNLRFYTNNSSTERMRITSAGNVGIGTATPGTKLEVSGATATILRITSSNNSVLSGESIGRVEFKSNDASTGGNNVMGFVDCLATNAGSTYALTLGTGLAAEATEKMRIDENGNVGIGTTSPSVKLQVSGEIDANGGDGYLINGMGFAQESSSLLTLGDWDGNGLTTRIMDNNSNEVLRAVNYGIGIGTTQPGSKLDIVGVTNTSNSSLLRVRTTDNPNAPEKVVGFYVNTSTERGFISVNQYQTTYSTSSDYRLKENIVPIPNGIERLKELKPCRFNFVQGDPNYVVDGFIAHEAAEVVPEAVTGEKDAVDENNNPSYQGIDQSKVVPLLTAALQEAISKIEQLEARIQTLENN